MLYACILAGGRGERFWPLSRAARPKQLANLTGEGTMLELTVARVRALIPPERILILTSEELAPAIRDELPDVPADQVLGEPVGRNSAPAIVAAAAWTLERDPDATLFVAPSDHIVDAAAFRAALEDAHDHVANRDALLTFGIAPTRPETAYGYVEEGESITATIAEARSFREKPDASTARDFVSSGRFFWNSGMFVWRSDAFLRAVDTHHEALAAAAGELRSELSWPERFARFYDAAPSISVDYAVMEHATNVVVRRSEFPWCDVGSWSALGDVVAPDPAGNVSVGPVKTLDVENCVLYADDGLLAAVGVRDIVAVKVGEVTMICPRSQAERVRDLVTALAADADGRTFL